MLFLPPAPAYADLYTITNLNTLAGVTWASNEGAALDINDNGEIVGYFGIYQSFLYSGGGVTYPVLRTSGGYDPGTYGDSWASGINNDGQVVGLMVSNWYGDYQLRNFLYDSGAVTDLGTLASTGYGQYPDIDDNGVIHPGQVSYQQSNLVNLLEDNDGWLSLIVHASTSSGDQIVGRGYRMVDDGSGNLHYQNQAFVARRVPEPATLPLIAVGITLLAAWRRRCASSNRTG